MASRLLSFDLPGSSRNRRSAARPGRISGDPKFRTWNLDEADGGLYAGIWEATPGQMAHRL